MKSPGLVHLYIIWTCNGDLCDSDEMRYSKALLNNDWMQGGIRSFGFNGIIVKLDSYDLSLWFSSFSCLLYPDHVVLSPLGV